MIAPLLTPEQVAEQLGVEVSTLAVWRCQGDSCVDRRGGPKFIRIGGLIRYRSSDVEFYISQRTVNPKAEALA